MLITMAAFSLVLSIGYFVGALSIAPIAAEGKSAGASVAVLALGAASIFFAVLAGNAWQ